jgi:methanogenic corrinoid protein MtbC1
MVTENFKDLAYKIAFGSAEEVEKLVKKYLKSSSSKLDIIQLGMVPSFQIIKDAFTTGRVSPIEVVNSVLRFASGIKALGISKKELKKLIVYVNGNQQTVYELCASVLCDLWRAAGFTERSSKIGTYDKFGIWGTFKILSNNGENLIFEVHYCPFRWIRIKIW